MIRRLALASAGLLLCGPFAAHGGVNEDFFRAIRRDDPRAIIRLLLRGFDPDSRDEAGRTGLQLALLVESYLAADALLSAPTIAIDAANANGETPLMLAALKGELTLCQRMVARGAQVNRAGWTPLHYAASGPDVRVVDWLLSQGALVDAAAPNGMTPLMMAAGYGSFASTERLLAAGAAPGLTNQRGLRAADMAKAAGRDGLADRLVGLATAR